MAYADLYTQYQSALPQGGGFNPLETEEERRKRLAAEAAGEEPTPVKETRTTDPVTGQVKLKIEGSEQDLSAANPLTPTVVAPKPPAAPELGAGYAGSALTPQFNFQSPAQTSAPTQPVAPPMPQPMAQTQMSQPQVQQPRLQTVAAPAVPLAPTNQNLSGVQVGDISDSAPGTQVTLGNGSMGIVGANGTIQAAPSQTVTPVAPVAPTNPVQTVPGAPAANAAPVTQTATTANVVPEGGFASTLGSVQVQPHVENFLKNQNNVNELAKLRIDQNTPDWLKRAAGKQEYDQLKYQYDTDRVKKEIEDAAKTNNTTKLARMFTDKKEDGSIAKAFLYSLIGYNSGAAAEVEKIQNARGIGATWQAGQIGSDSVAIKVNKDGSVKEGLFTSGDRAGQALSPEEMALTYGQGTAGGVGAKALKAEAGMPYEQIGSNGEVLARGIRSTKFINGRTVTGVESGGVFHPFDPSWRPESISTSTTKAIEKAKVDFATSPSIAGAKKLMEQAAEDDMGDGKIIEATKKQIREKLGNSFDFSTITTPTIPPPVKEGAKKVLAPVEPSSTGGMMTTAYNTNQEPSSTGGMMTTAYNANQEPSGFIQTSSGRDFGRESPAMYRERLRRETAAAEAEVQKNKELEVAEKKPPAEQKGKNAAKDINDQRQADETYKILRPISDAVKQSTGSGIGAGVDTLAGIFGKGTTGAENIAKLEVLSYKLLQQVPRMEGSQSNIDVEMYKKAAGDLGNDKKPVSVRLAALETIIEMLKIADKKGANDWSFGQEKAQPEFRVIKREKIQ